MHVYKLYRTVLLGWIKRNPAWLKFKSFLLRTWLSMPKVLNCHFPNCFYACRWSLEKNLFRLGQSNFRIKFEILYLCILETGSWVHFAGTYSSAASKAAIFINGVLVQEARGAGSLSEDWDGKAWFGVHKGLAGDMLYIDEIMAYNRALTPFEVKNLFGKCNFGGGGSGKVDRYYSTKSLLSFCLRGFFIFRGSFQVLTHQYAVLFVKIFALKSKT